MKKTNIQIKSSKLTMASKIIRPNTLIQIPKPTKLGIVYAICGLVLFIMFVIAAIESWVTYDSITNYYANLFILTLVTIIMFCSTAVNIRKVFIHKSFKNTQIKNGFVCVCLVVFCALGIWLSSNYIRDVPYAISSDYTVIEGQCSDSTPIYLKNPHLSITINNKLFDTSLNYKEFIAVGNIYRIEYLPYSQEVINVYKIMPR